MILALNEKVLDACLHCKNCLDECIYRIVMFHLDPES